VIHRIKQFAFIATASSTVAVVASAKSNPGSQKQDPFIPAFDPANLLQVQASSFGDVERFVSGIVVKGTWQVAGGQRKAMLRVPIQVDDVAAEGAVERADAWKWIVVSAGDAFPHELKVANISDQSVTLIRKVRTTDGLEVQSSHAIPIGEVAP